MCTDWLAGIVPGAWSGQTPPMRRLLRFGSQALPVLHFVAGHCDLGLERQDPAPMRCPTCILEGAVIAMIAGHCDLGLERQDPAHVAPAAQVPQIRAGVRPSSRWLCMARMPCTACIGFVACMACMACMACQRLERGVGTRWQESRKPRLHAPCAAALPCKQGWRPSHVCRHAFHACAVRPFLPLQAGAN